MKQLLILLTLLAGFVIGCNPVSMGEIATDTSRKHLDGQNGDVGLVDSKEQRWVRNSLINDINIRQMQDDWDYIWLYERNSQLTEWVTEIPN